MTANAVIEQIKALPPEERAKVVGYLHELEQPETPRAVSPNEKAFDAAADWVFKEHAELMHKLSQ